MLMADLNLIVEPQVSDLNTECSPIYVEQLKEMALSPSTSTCNWKKYNLLLKEMHLEEN